MSCLYATMLEIFPGHAYHCANTSVLLLQLRNITSIVSRMLYHLSTAPSPGLHSVLQPLLQMYLNWSTASIRLADGPQHSSRQQCDQPSQHAAADSSKAHASLAVVVQGYCTTSGNAQDVAAPAAGGVDAAILLTAATEAQHWELADAVACLMGISLKRAAGNGSSSGAQSLSGRDAGSSEEDSKLRESATAACRVLVMMNHGGSAGDASGNISPAQQVVVDSCRNELVQVLLHYGCLAGQDLQQVMASTGIMKQLCGLLTLAAEHQAAAAQQAGPSASRQRASAQVSGIITTIKSIRHPAAQLLCDVEAMPLMEQMMQVGSWGM